MIGAGQDLGGYTIIKRIGGGGLGEVFLAQHRRVNRRAAIKVLLPELSQKEAVLEQFFKEARNTSLIKHPGIVEILDCDLLDGQAFIITEFLEGESLGGYLKRNGPLGEDLAFLLGAIAAVADTVEAAHLAGIMHRDLKPENVYLQLATPTEPVVTVRVLDFGIAKLSREDGGPSQTKTGLWLGSPTYMSPEQCRGVGRPDARSDVYSLGCVMYEALCGQPPFNAPGIAELIVAHATQPPKPPLKLVPELPPKLNALILRMLAKKPEERPQTMSQVVGSLRDIARAQGIDFEGPLQPLAPVERPTALLGAALAGVARPAPTSTPAPVARPIEPRVARPIVAPEPPPPAPEPLPPAPAPRAVPRTLERGADVPVPAPVVGPVIAPEARLPRALPRTLLAGSDQRQAVAAGRMPEQPIEAFAGGTMILEGGADKLAASRQPPPSMAIQAVVGGTKIMEQVDDPPDDGDAVDRDDEDDHEDSGDRRSHPERTMRVAPTNPGAVERMLSVLRDNARLAVIVGGGIVLVAVVTTLLLTSITAPPKHAKHQVREVVEEPPSPPEPVVQPPPPTPPVEAERPAPAAVPTVQIDIQGIAPDTVVTVDDQPATLPVRIRRGPELHRFTLHPPSGSERTIEIDGTRDRVIELVMAHEPKTAPTPPAERPHPPAKSPPPHAPAKPKPGLPASDRKAITDI